MPELWSCLLTPQPTALLLNKHPAVLCSHPPLRVSWTASAVCHVLSSLPPSPLSLPLHLLCCTAHTTQEARESWTLYCEHAPPYQKQRETESERKKERERGGAEQADVSSDIKCKGDASALDVITQGCCCRQEWRGGGGCYREQRGCLSNRNNDFSLASQCTVHPNSSNRGRGRGNHI